MKEKEITINTLVSMIEKHFNYKYVNITEATILTKKGMETFTMGPGSVLSVNFEYEENQMTKDNRAVPKKEQRKEWGIRFKAVYRQENYWECVNFIRNLLTEKDTEIENLKGACKTLREMAEAEKELSNK